MRCRPSRGRQGTGGESGGTTGHASSLVPPGCQSGRGMHREARGRALEAGLRRPYASGRRARLVRGAQVSCWRAEPRLTISSPGHVGELRWRPLRAGAAQEVEGGPMFDIQAGHHDPGGHAGMSPPGRGRSAAGRDYPRPPARRCAMAVKIMGSSWAVHRLRPGRRGRLRPMARSMQPVWLQAVRKMNGKPCRSRRRAANSGRRSIPASLRQ